MGRSSVCIFCVLDSLRPSLYLRQSFISVCPPPSLFLLVALPLARPFFRHVTMPPQTRTSSLPLSLPPPSLFLLVPLPLSPSFFRH